MSVTTFIGKEKEERELQQLKELKKLVASLPQEHFGIYMLVERTLKPGVQ